MTYFGGLTQDSSPSLQEYFDELFIVSCEATSQLFDFESLFKVVKTAFKLLDVWA
jgi:hypothetical protein